MSNSKDLDGTYREVGKDVAGLAGTRNEFPVAYTLFSKDLHEINVVLR